MLDFKSVNNNNFNNLTPKLNVKVIKIYLMIFYMSNTIEDYNNK